MDTCIGLRTMVITPAKEKIRRRKIHLGRLRPKPAPGIVADSIPASEHARVHKQSLPRFLKGRRPSPSADYRRNAGVPARLFVLDLPMNFLAHLAPLRSRR